MCSLLTLFRNLTLAFLLFVACESKYDSHTGNVENEEIHLSSKSKFTIYKHIQEYIQSNYTRVVPPSWADAFLMREGRKFPIKIKLRGDLPKHWNGEYSSYEIKVYADDGRKIKIEELSYIISEDKYYFVEGLAYFLGKKLGLKTPDTNYRYISVNDSKPKHYLIKDATRKLFIEKNLLRGSSLFKQKDIFKKQVFGIETYYRNIFNKNDFNNISDYNSEYYSAYGDQDNIAILDNFFENFKAGKGIVELDTEIYLNWIALQLFFNSIHASAGDNKIWLYNRGTMRIEPLIYDVLLGETYYPVRDRIDYLSRKNKLFKRLLLEENTRNIIMSNLSKILELKKEMLSYIQTYESNLSRTDRNSSSYQNVKKIFIKNLTRLSGEL